MSKTLHQFGRVLFDELEQIAVRRGGFAGLMWVKENLEKAQRDVEELRKKRTDQTVESSSPRKTADECAQQVRDALALAARTTEAVDRLCQIMGDIAKMAKKVRTKLKPSDQAPARARALKSPVELMRAVFGRFRQREDRKAWEQRVKDVELKLSRHDESCRKAEEALEQIRKVVDEAVKQIALGSEVLLSDDFASALQNAVAKFAKIGEAFNWTANVKQAPVVELGSLVAEQPAASRYEIYEIVEDAARKSAMRMGTVGLAFSGGGIRSATFNLGFLQGAAALGLLKQFDYLSTVSGGGYIGAWFAAWVLREGGGPGDPESAAKLDAKMLRTSRALENVQKQLNSSRARQARAVRRWAWPAGNPPLPPKPTLEDEPEPIHHLREHSNYLAPKIGLLSIDTWTMVSVYLRNLFLNQFIVLPMLLVLVTLPRLSLLLFSDSTWGPMVTHWRGWQGWLVGAAPVAAVLAVVTAPQLVDFVARRVVGWLHRRNSEMATVLLVAIGMTTLALVFMRDGLPWLVPPNSPWRIQALVRWLQRNPWATGLTVFLLVVLAAVLAAVINRSRVDNLVLWVARGPYQRTKAWVTLLILVSGIASLAISVFTPALDFVESFMELLTGDRNWLTGDRFLFLGTLLMAWLGFHGTYNTVAQIRGRRRFPAGAPAHLRARFDLTKRMRWIIFYLTADSFGVTLLFARPENPFSVYPSQILTGWFDPANWFGQEFGPALRLGGLVGLMRALSSLTVNLKDRSLMSTPTALLRAHSALSSGMISGAGLAAALSWLRGLEATTPDGPWPVMMSLGPAFVMLAIGAGSAIEVGLIGGYGEEDMREWRASLGAYLMIVGAFWASLAVLSIYGPLFVWWARGWPAGAAGAGLVVISVVGAVAGRSERTDRVKATKRPLEYLGLVAPPAFLIGIVVAVAVLVAALQGVDFPIKGADTYLAQLTHADANRSAERTWIVMLASAYMWIVGSVHANVNLFGLKAFYANRLVRCYLGASRPREAPAQGRPNFAPTNSPGPVRRPNPTTGFDPNDDFPLHKLAIVRCWDRDDLVVDYRGPYHLINTAMNLVAGSELAWQERMAESFILSPLYCGSKTTGYRPTTKIEKSDLEDDEVEPKDWWRAPSSAMSGYGDDIRLGTAISLSGAAASPNAGYRSSPLVTILMTILNARLGLWLGNPARLEWRRSGPQFAFYFLRELLGRTTSEDNYVYLSDGGHFENLGTYELVRRRCRYIVVCDAGADPGLAFWDLGSLVRKCRQDFGIRIEIDVSPLFKKEGTPHAKWHCAVGQIHYDDVDVEALPGTLIYIKPSLSGDEPSDVRNYLVDHPSFPHEPTSNQFFSESQFESYRELGEHIALDVFGDAVRDAGPDCRPAELFSTLRRRWIQAPPNLDKGFLESMKPFVKIHQALRTDPKLQGLSHELYRELEQPPSDGPGAAATLPPAIDRSHVHAVIEMLQAVQSAWIAMNLDVDSDQPLNAGWMNVFRRWISSGIFQAHWPAVRGEFSEGFIRFCETELNLTVQEPKFAWLKGYPNKKCRTIAPSEFEKGLKELDKEFLLEWPRVVYHEIKESRSGLADMFEHACKHPAGREGRPMAVLILRDETVHGRRPASEHSPAGEARYERGPTSEPSYYGVILAWGSPDGVVELVLWLRGAYATLGIGEAIEKTIRDFKEELEAIRPEGYALRTRYPSDDRSRGKQRWRRTVWTDFFRNQGFHRDDSDTSVNAPDILIYRWEQR